MNCLSNLHLNPLNCMRCDAVFQLITSSRAQQTSKKDSHDRNANLFAPWQYAISLLTSHQCCQCSCFTLSCYRHCSQAITSRQLQHCRDYNTHCVRIVCCHAADSTNDMMPCISIMTSVLWLPCDVYGGCLTSLCCCVDDSFRCVSKVLHPSVGSSWRLSL